MAYLTFSNSEDRQSTCFKFIGTENKTASTSLLSDGSTSTPISLLASDIGGGEDSCSFYNGPSDSVIYAFGESTETSGSIAYSSDSTETSGSIAYSGGCDSSVSVSTSSSCSSSSFTCCC